MVLALSILALAVAAQAAEPINLGNRRELFVDHFFIEQRSGTQLRLHTPRDEGIALKFDVPWEGGFSGYVTIVQLSDKMRAYYRGKPIANKDGSDDEVTCCAESTDGIHWTRPDVGVYEVQGTRKNNVVLMKAHSVTHNFSPFLDDRPGVPG